MATQSKSEIAELARALAQKELDSNGHEHPSELLDALETVARAIKRSAGGDDELSQLADQVQEVVKNSKISK